MKYFFEEDDLGWSIDLKCPKCDKFDCLGSFVCWTPRSEEFPGLKEALDDAIEHQKMLNVECSNA